MDQQGKVWGTTHCLFKSPFFSVHLLLVSKGGYCSEHRHERKLNHFHVLFGKLKIFEWPAPGIDQDQPDVTTLIAGESKVVPVGAWHQFKAVEECLCLEIYEAAPVEEDIIRRTTGGNPSTPPDDEEGA